MKIGKLTFNGVTSSSLGVFVSGSGTYGAAAYDFTPYQIPGRNGDLIIPNGRYQNIQVTYPAFIPNALPSKIQAVRNWIRSALGYARIEDNYDPEHYRMGFGVDLFEVTPARNEGANFQLVFECMPQRFRTSGDAQTSVSNNGTVNNPTQYEAKPLITITGLTSSGRLTVGSYTLTATSSYSGTISIDCDTMNIYSGSTNLNSRMSGDFPVLKPGNNTVTFSGISTVKITPRWWEL